MKKLVFDIGGTMIKFALMDDQAVIYDQGEVPTPLDTFESLMEKLMQIYNKYENEVEGIAMSLPGVIDSQKGFIHFPGSLSYNENSYFIDRMRAYIDRPIAIENDGKAAALAELWKGHLRDVSSGIVLTLGTGIGGGIIVDKKLIKGSHFFAGEFSMLSTNEHFKGRDMLAFKASTAALVKNYAIAKGLDQTMTTGHDVFKAIAQKDAVAINALDDMAIILATQIINLQCIIDPDRILIGGGISRQPIVVETIKKHVETIYRDFPFVIPRATIDTCYFFNDANLIGALYNYLLRFSKEAL